MSENIVPFVSTTPSPRPRAYAARRLPLKAWDDIGTTTPPDALVRGLLGTTALAVLYGEPGCGKTFLAADMGLHIALGREWLGRPVARGAALYVAAEGAGGLPNRLAAFRKVHKIEGSVPFAVVPAAVDLGPGGQDAAAVVAAGEELADDAGVPVALVVIDTLARCIGTGDENSARDMGAFVTACDVIRTNLRCAVLVVHHSGKAHGAGMRGSTALLGAVDTVLHVDKLAAGHRLTVEKQKDGEAIELRFDLDVVEVGQDAGEPITTCVVRPVDGEPATALTGRYRQALETLAAIVASQPAPAAGSVTNPVVTAVAESTWREALKTAGVTGTQNERETFRRVREKLNKMGLIGLRDGMVFLHRHTPSQAVTVSSQCRADDTVTGGPPLRGAASL